MFTSPIATALRTARVGACVGMASILLVSACSSAPPSMRAATTSPSTATGGSVNGNPPARPDGRRWRVRQPGGRREVLGATVAGGHLRAGICRRRGR